MVVVVVVPMKSVQNWLNQLSHYGCAHVRKTCVMWMFLLSGYSSSKLISCFSLGLQFLSISAAVCKMGI